MQQRLGWMGERSELATKLLRRRCEVTALGRGSRVTTGTQTFKTQASARALLDQIYDVKFSKHTPLIVVLLGMIYTIFRSADYLDRVFHLPGYVAWPTAIFLELLVLAGSASVFIALRNIYVAELKGADVSRAKWGLVVGVPPLALAFVALLFVAWADAYEITRKPVPSLIMTLVQATQMMFMLGFIVAADQDEREKLRVEYTNYKRDQASASANQCPHCFKEVSINNRARHIQSCPARIQEGN